MQNNFYNDWAYGHHILAVLVFYPDGTIPIACFNIPLSVDNSTMTDFGNIYAKLEKVYNKPLEGKCTIDLVSARK